jgi:tRNA pseudouridine13 synthase
MLRVRPCDIGYAGTKDKRACTGQWCTLFKLPASKVASIVNDSFIASKGEEGRQLLVGNFQYSESNLDLGDLGGNRFGITLRQLRQCNKELTLSEPATAAADSSVNIMDDVQLSARIEHACKTIQQSGFINFFGIQRFGSGGINTADLGKAVLLNDWESVVSHLMSPRGGDKEGAVLAKHVYNTTKDAQLALRVMPPWVGCTHTHTHLFFFC